MAYTNKISKVRLYDNIDGREEPVSISWSSQEIGTGTDTGRFGQLTTTSAVPGRLDDATPAAYTRTDITGFPAPIQAILTACWSDDLHTVYEAHLRAQ